MSSVSTQKENAVATLFGGAKALIGVVHCRPFPGAPRHRGERIEAICDAALRDAEAYLEGGLNGLIVENHGDIPFRKPGRIGHETAAYMAVVTDRIRRRFDAPVGINVLANAAIPALAVASAAGAAFVRVNQWANAYVANEGIVEGEAAEALRYRSAIAGNDIRIFADSHVKHGSHAITADRTVNEQTRDLEFFDADAVIATGQRTGDVATMEEIDEIRAATELPVLVGSGVSEKTAAAILERTDGFIIASSLKEGGVWWNSVEPKRVKALVAALGR